MNVPDERNRNKLYDALASGALVSTGDTYPVADGMLERSFNA